MMQGQRCRLKGYQGEHWPIRSPELTLDFLGHRHEALCHRHEALCQVLWIMSVFLASSTQDCPSPGQDGRGRWAHFLKPSVMELLQG